MKKNGLLDKDLLKQYYSIFSNKNNLKDFKSYYLAFVRFINQNREFFTDTILEKWDLNVLITLNPDNYLVKNPDISLPLEEKRLRGDYDDIDTLVMSIRDTLWDMITIYSGKDCPITPNDELRYILLKNNDGKEKLLLECAACGWTENIDGNEYNDPTGTVYPVNKKDLERYFLS
ncbi:hypothetical protein K6959_16270 [Bacillus aquiflavi]|uniref:hypothetical protein n=1 Tax=Bacillus aquiflavi TaxID=2672567 RepID=UPI001CA86381|nr:hypothetical protein [Bacillus aquiflavi]UAC48111.1 hypothetical protein K6959_16270 [Bacillus aquiflavi]